MQSINFYHAAFDSAVIGVISVIAAHLVLGYCSKKGRWTDGEKSLAKFSTYLLTALFVFIFSAMVVATGHFDLLR